MAPKSYVRIQISGIVNVISFGKRISINEIKDLVMRSSWVFQLGPNPMKGVLRMDA